MKVAPIIHTRTFSCDFNSEFLVRPKMFMNSDIKWARENVLGATKEIDSLQGVRWMITDNGKYRIAGVVGFLKDICSLCNLSEEKKQKSQELFCDNKGRLVYAFIGVVIDKLNNTNYETISSDYLWNMYLDKIYPIWKSTYQEIILEDFVNIPMQRSFNNIDLENTEVGSKKLFETNQNTDFSLFSNLICDKNKDNFSFCSNIINFNVVKQSNFSIITTSENIITRMKKEIPNLSKNNLNKECSPSLSNIDRNNEKYVYETKKKNFMILIVFLMILVVIILILLLKN